ncbi:MAG: hypothetical protein E7527_03980 [Ruminococcaceae bacterium]|nr:hypothetical protein [Oscillospiraceae bacterium]
MKESWQTFLKRVGTKDGKLRWLFWLGLAGVMLIALSEWLPMGSEPEPATSLVLSERQVEQALEQRITTLLSSVEGVGRCRVLVTLESGTQTVYAADTRIASDAAGQTTDTTFLRVETDTGPVGLKLTELQPTIKGVAVVCEGGGNPAVCERVTQVVTTAFQISQRRVCVVKQN